MNSRSKGYRGEKEWRDLVEKHLGIKIRPAQCGTKGDDFKIGPFSGETKRCERIELWKWIDQAQEQAKDRNWLVAHRKSGKDWIVCMDALTFFRLVREEVRVPEPWQLSNMDLIG